MNVLFALSDTGFGHRSAARAIEAALRDRVGPGVRTDIVDVYGEFSVPLLRSTPDLYARSSRHGRPAFDALFGLSNQPATRSGVIRALDGIARRRLVGAIAQFRPDIVVICNPFYMGELFTRARERSGHRFEIATVVTDPVTVHQSWLAQKADMHFVVEARPSVADAHRSEGFACREIAFPSHPVFAATEPGRLGARAALDLDPARPVALVTGGGAGGGRLQEWDRLVRRLTADRRIQVLVAPGTNRLLASYFVGPGFENVRVLPASGSLNLPMRASSAVFSKAGPATIFEAAAVGAPLLLFDEVGRQERGNIALAERLGVGQALGHRDVARVVVELDELPPTPRPELASGAFEVADWISSRLRVA